MTHDTDIDDVVALVERQRLEGLHPGAQLYVSRWGEVVCDVAIGEASPGTPLTPGHLLLWYSSSKPLTAVAVAQLLERGDLHLDDPVERFVAGWGNGKEGCTVRHVLTHMGGFSRADVRLFDSDVGWDETLAAIAASRAEYRPGTKAGYHPSSGWRVLGEVVRAVDGRPIDQYLREEVMAPAGMTDTWVGIPADDQALLADRLSPVHWTGHVIPVPNGATLELREYRVERWHNEVWHRAKVEPGGGGRGPASDLGRLYEALLLDGGGRLFRRPETVALLTACHRHGVWDRTFGAEIPWGLGVQVAGGITGTVGHRTFGHGGMASSRGICDPVEGLVMVYVCNGLAAPEDNERRMREVTDAVYAAVCPEPSGARITGTPIVRTWST